MKRILFSVAAIFLFVNLAVAQSFGTYSLETNLSKEDCMDRIDEWVALNLGSYSLNVDYKNEKTGRTIIKGVFVPGESAMYSVYRNALKASIEYTIVTEAKDNECIITFNSLYYCFKPGGYVDYDSIATSNLNLMVAEMELIEEIGERIEITPELLEKASGVIDEFNSVKEKLQDQTLKKSERKKIQKELDSMESDRNVYQDISLNSAKFLQALVSSFEKALK